MSTLKERLDRIREGFEAQASAEVLTVMHKAADDLRNSWSLGPAAQPGSTLPAFELPDTEGQLVRSADLLSKRPLIATFYRGMW
jgi:hypothetical protein